MVKLRELKLPSLRTIIFTGVGIVLGSLLTAFGTDLYQRVVARVFGPSTEHVTDAVIEAKDGPSTLEEYCSSLDKLEGRFLEHEELRDSLRESNVTWDGYVRSVARPMKDVVAVVIETAAESGCQAFIVFGADQETKLFSLRRGDKVRILGRLEPSGTMPTVWGTSVEVVGPTGGTAGSP